jgi:hypothetical protein
MRGFRAFAVVALLTMISGEAEITDFAGDSRSKKYRAEGT